MNSKSKESWSIKKIVTSMLDATTRETENSVKDDHEPSLTTILEKSLMKTIKIIYKYDFQTEFDKSMLDKDDYEKISAMMNFSAKTYGIYKIKDWMSKIKAVHDLYNIYDENRKEKLYHIQFLYEYRNTLYQIYISKPDIDSRQSDKIRNLRKVSVDIYDKLRLFYNNIQYEHDSDTVKIETLEQLRNQLAKYQNELEKNEHSKTDIALVDILTKIYNITYDILDIYYTTLDTTIKSDSKKINDLHREASHRLFKLTPHSSLK